MMKTQIRGAAFVLALCVASLPMQARASGRLAPIETVVDTDGMAALPDHAEFVRGKLDGAVQTELGSLDVPVPAAVQLRVEFMKGKKVGYYAYSASTKYDGRVLESDVVTGTCEVCDTAELMAKVDAALEVQRKAIERENAARDAASPPIPASSEPTTGPTSEPPGEFRPHGQPPRWTALGKTGVGMMALGLGAGVAGVVLLVRPDRVRGEPPQVERGTTRPPGIALAVAGGAVLVAGVVMLAVDVSRQKKGREAVLGRLRFDHGGFAVRF